MDTKPDALDLNWADAAAYEAASLLGFAKLIPDDYESYEAARVHIKLTIERRCAALSRAEAAERRVDVANNLAMETNARLNRAERRVAELEARLADQEWRPVTEPPQMADNYHVWRRPGYHDFCHFNGVNWRTTGGDSVTHWRPLPAPPID